MSRTATITSPTDRTVLVWGVGNFTIAGDDPATGAVNERESFAFIIPSGGAILNKVGYTVNTAGQLVADNATINGTLNSTGKVFVLANGNINVGSGASITTNGGLFLSTLLETSDFPFTTGGNLSFTGASTGAITLGSTGAAPVAVQVGGLGAWAGTIVVNNLTVAGDLILNSTTSGQGLTIAGAGNPTSVSGNLTVRTNSGPISQGLGGALSVGGTSSLMTNGTISSTAAGITLDNLSNNFTGVVTVSSAGSVRLSDIGGISLAASTIGGDLFVNTSGSIVTTGAVAVTGNATLTARGPVAVPQTISFANGSSVLGTAGISASTYNGPITIDTIGNLTTGTISASAGISSVSITDGGSLYTATPGVAFSAAGPVGAASVTNGSVTSISLSDTGTGLTSAPIVTIGGGAAPAGGTLATAVTTLTVPNITVNTTGVATINGPVTATTAAGGSVTYTAPTITATTLGSITAAGVTLNATTSLTTPAITAAGVQLLSGIGGISQAGTSIITAPGINANSGLGNIFLTNNNPISNISVIGANVSVTSVSSLTVSGATTTGNLTLSTLPAAGGATGAVTIGSGGGTAAQGVTVGGSLNISTNGSAVSDDPSANILVNGSVNINTLGSSGGGIIIAPVVSGGSGYTPGSSVAATFTGGTAGTSAAGTAIINSAGQLVGLNITNAGTGYTSAPVITIAGTGAGASVTTLIGGLGNVTFNGATAGQGGSGRFGQFNVSGNAITIHENTTLNLGNITAGSIASTNSTAGDILVTGNVTVRGNAGEWRASSGKVEEVGAGVVNIGGTVSFNTSNSFGANLSNSANIFNGAVRFINGGTDILVASSNVTFAAGNVTSGTVTVNTVNPNWGTVFVGSNQNFAATDVRVNAAGPIVIQDTTPERDRPTVRNLTLNTTSTLPTSITQTNPLTANGTVSITTPGGVLLTNVANNITGSVVFNSVAGDAAVYSSRNLTVSGNVTGTLTAVAGTQAGNANSFSNAWSLILGNLHVGNLNGTALNGGTPLSTRVLSVTVPAGGTGTGYTNGAAITINPVTTNPIPALITALPGATPATGTIQTDPVTGAITGVTITNPGTGFLPGATIAAGSILVGSASTGIATFGGVVLATASGATLGGVAAEGNSGTITQSSNARLHVENVLNLATFNGDIVVGNNGNSNGRVQFSTGGALGLSGTSGNITYVEDPTVRLGNIHTGANATITSRFGSIIEDPTANVVLNVGGTLTLNAPNGSVQIGGLTRTTVGTTTLANVANFVVNATGSAQLFSSGNLTLSSMSVNSLTVTSMGTISQSGPLRVFGAAVFNAANGITLNDTQNNFGPVTLNVTNINQNVAITEGGTLNLRTVIMPGTSNGTFTATSVNGDIIDTGLSGVVVGGRVGTPGSGIITLSAANGNITIDDPTTDFPSNSGISFNARNVTLSVLGQGGTNLVLGANGTNSVVSGNLTATSALGDIANAGNIIVTGDAFFQTGTRNITLNQAGNQFGTLRFVGNQVSIQQTGDMKIVTGSQAIGPAQLATNSGNITIVDRGGLVTFGNTVSMSASGNITLPKLLQAANTLSVNANGTKDLSALSISGDLSGRAPINSGSGPYLPPQP